MTRLVVLYEDARAASGRFGPHELLLGCVADELGRSLHDLRREIDATPMNGVAKLLAAKSSSSSRRCGRTSTRAIACSESSAQTPGDGRFETACVAP